MNSKKSAAMLLFFTSPLLAELLSSSAPPSEFFGIGGLIILALYGPGVVLIREVAVREKMRLSSIVALGVAYGVPN